MQYTPNTLTALEVTVGGASSSLLSPKGRVRASMRSGGYGGTQHSSCHTVWLYYIHVAAALRWRTELQAQHRPGNTQRVTLDSVKWLSVDLPVGVTKAELPEAVQHWLCSVLLAARKMNIYPCSVRIM